MSNYSNYSNYHCAAAMSGAWVKNGGWFKKEERDGKPFARCTFMEEDGSVCPKEMAVHQYNMWEHLQNVHRFTKDDAQRRLAAASKGGMRTFTVALKRPPLSKDQESEYETLLAVALANQGMPLSCFDKRTPKHMAVIEPSGESVYEDIERFTLHNWLLHVFPEFHGVSRNTMMKRLEGEAMQLNMVGCRNGDQNARLCPRDGGRGAGGVQGVRVGAAGLQGSAFDWCLWAHYHGAEVPPHHSSRTVAHGAAGDERAI